MRLSRFPNLTRRLWADVFLWLSTGTAWFRVCQRAGASSRLYHSLPVQSSKCIQSQTVFCHVGFSQGSYFGESHPLWEKCSIISPYSSNKFSRVKEKHSDCLAPGFSHASPPNCTAHPTTPDSPQRAWAACSANQTYPCQCCLRHHRDMHADTDWGITVTPGFQFAVNLQPQDSDLKRMWQTPLQGSY